MILRFVDIGEIADAYCLNFLFIVIQKTINSAKLTSGVEFRCFGKIRCFYSNSGIRRVTVKYK